MTMTEPRFPVQVIRGVPVVVTPQEIDITNASALRAALLHASAAHPGADLVADMTRTRFCDSAGLHALTGAHKRTRAEGRQVTSARTCWPPAKKAWLAAQVQAGTLADRDKTGLRAGKILASLVGDTALGDQAHRVT